MTNHKGILLAIGLSSIIAASVFAQGTAFTYQGRLNSGTNAVTGIFDFQFALSNAPTGGNQIGNTITNLGVGVTNGLFTTTLDFSNVFTGQPAWLAISVRTNGASTYLNLAPLQPITPAPYAVYANTASNLSGSISSSQIFGQLPSSLLGGTYSGTLNFNNAGNSFAGSGAGLTGLNANNLSTGTVPDARLSANVALRNSANTFTGIQVVSNGTFQVGNASGQFGFYGFPPSGGTALLGSFLTADTNWPQLRFSRTMGGNYMDIGQNANGDFVVEGNDVGRFVVQAGGNVGIGLTNPATALQVNGTVTATSFSGDGSGLTNISVPVSGSQVTSVGNGNSGSSQNFFVGPAGNASTTGSQNTADGVNALSHNTSGAANTAFGLGALQFNSSGSGNTAIGVGALFDNGNGTGNTAIGDGALFNAAGTSNIAIGSSAGINIAAGGSNIDIGNPGVTTDANIIRIGTTGIHTTTFLAGTVIASNLSVSGTSQIAPLTVPPKVPAAAVGSVGTDGGAYYVALAGNYAYVVSFDQGTLQIFDVSNPSAPVRVGSVSAGNRPAAMTVAGNYAYVVNWGNTLQVFDVNNPAAPSALGSAATGAFPNSVAVAGNYAYVADSDGTLQVFDVSNPSGPIRVGSLATGSANILESVVVAGRYAYVANGGANSLQVFDISFPSFPIMVGTVGTDGGPISVAIAGRYAYVANSDGNTLQVFDVSNPFSPVMAGRVNTGNTPVSVAVAGRYAYVANSSGNTLQLFDVSNPGSPASIGTVSTGSAPYWVAVAGRYAYVVNNGNSSLQVFDLGGAYVQQFEAGAAKVGTLQTLDTVTVGNGLNVRNGLNVGANALVSGGLSVTGPLRLGTGTSIFNLQSGQAVMPSSSTQEATFTITFPVAFSTTPKIIFSLANDPAFQGVSDVFASSVSSNSLTAFTINVYRLNGTLWSQQLRVNWQAWQ